MDLKEFFFNIWELWNILNTVRSASGLSVFDFIDSHNCNGSNMFYFFNPSKWSNTLFLICTTECYFNYNGNIWIFVAWKNKFVRTSSLNKILVPFQFRASSERLRTWKIINLLRVIGAVLGWLAVAIALDDDYTESKISFSNYNFLISRFQSHIFVCKRSFHQCL